MKTKRWIVMWAFEPWFLCFWPFGRDEKTDELKFLKPSFKFMYFKGRPTKTKWRFDWYVHLGWLYVYRKAEE